jgi:predicted O-methyltransferase YrrM
MAMTRWSRPTPPYLALLDRIQRTLRPRAYLEIGVHRGTSIALALPGTRIVGIDPDPHLRLPVRRWADVHRRTSDDFFATYDRAQALGDTPLDLAFIDGMHQFDFALRDFMHIERWSHPGTTVLIHDCYPVGARPADPVRTSEGWSGDIWKLIVCLRQERPDLQVAVADIGPTGLGIVTGLDATSGVLEDRYEEVLARYDALAFTWLEEHGKAEALARIPGTWDAVEGHLGPGPFRSAPGGWLRARRALRPAHWPYVIADAGYRGRAWVSRHARGRGMRPAGSPA